MNKTNYFRSVGVTNSSFNFKIIISSSETLAPNAPKNERNEENEQNELNAFTERNE